MRIKKISARNIPPVEYFEVDNLSDLVVIAGPNGVGKTRLITSLLQYFQNFSDPSISFEIEATSESEKVAFGGQLLVTSDANDAGVLRALLQKNRRRRNLKSSIVNFESNRSIQNVSPLSFQFEFPDPDEEEIGWNISFGGLANRWQDTQHAIFKKIQSQKTSIASKAIQLRKQGHSSMNLDFKDPLDPFREAFSQLLGPKSLGSADIQRQVITYEHDGHTREISTLSSGEKEVVNITFDFLLRKPSDCVVFFDEPELHLHPELLTRLISTLKNVGDNNQFVLISHSPEVISSSLDDSVIFLTPPGMNGDNQGVKIDSTDENAEALARLGQSIGIVALGKKIVLIEGKSSSLDKQTYSHILKNKYPNLVLLPSGGKDNLKSFDVALTQILDRAIWGVQFYMLADRDAFLPNTEYSRSDISNHSRFQSLQKYHLENYFLDPDTLAYCFHQMEPQQSWLRDPAKIRDKLRVIAEGQLSYAVSLIVSKALRDKVGNVDVMGKSLENLDEVALSKELLAMANAEKDRVNSVLDDNEVASLTSKVTNDLQLLLNSPEDAWMIHFPGKPIFGKFCGLANINQGRLKTLYISNAGKSGSNPFSELFDVFEKFSKTN